MRNDLIFRFPIRSWVLISAMKSSVFWLFGSRMAKRTSVFFVKDNPSSSAFFWYQEHVFRPIGTGGRCGDIRNSGRVRERLPRWTEVLSFFDIGSLFIFRIDDSSVLDNLDHIFCIVIRVHSSAQQELWMKKNPAGVADMGQEKVSDSKKEQLQASV